MPAGPPPATELFPWERVLVLLSCAFSAVGSGLLVGTHALWPELRTRPRQLLLYLSLADLLSAAAYFYGVLKAFQGPSWDCVAQGALSTFANTSSFFWTMAVALYLYLTIVRGAPTGAGLLWLFHAVSWGVPLGITAAAVALKKIGYDASDVSVGWCWIDIEVEDRVLWMLLAGKLWEILAYLALPIFYILIRKHISRAGIGNTFQGGANCIMFVLCTRVVRNKLFSCLCCWQYNSLDPSLPSPESCHRNHAAFPKDWESEDSEWDRAEFAST